MAILEHRDPPDSAAYSYFFGRPNRNFICICTLYSMLNAL